jgi:alpha-L-fucosidase
MQLYKRAGAKYFVALANHHDNFDAYDSKYHAWNSVNVGPKKDIVGTWAKVARAHGLRFGVSNHSSHAWHWFQPAYGHDARARWPACPTTPHAHQGRRQGQVVGRPRPAGPLRRVRLPMPDGVTDAKAANDWHAKNDGNWWEKIPPSTTATRQLVPPRPGPRRQISAGPLYFDDIELPLGQAGLESPRITTTPTSRTTAASWRPC